MLCNSSVVCAWYNLELGGKGCVGNCRDDYHENYYDYRSNYHDYHETYHTEPRGWIGFTRGLDSPLAK